MRSSSEKCSASQLFDKAMSFGGAGSAFRACAVQLRYVHVHQCFFKVMIQMFTRSSLAILDVHRQLVLSNLRLECRPALEKARQGALQSALRE